VTGIFVKGLCILNYLRWVCERLWCSWTGCVIVRRNQVRETTIPTFVPICFWEN